jgi:hypothetical protein
MPSSISGRGRLKLRSAKKRDMVTANGVSVLQKETCHGDRRGGRSGEWQDWCAARHRPTLPPFGAGEASTAPVAAALANAVFDATGVRLRAVPFTPDRVKAALAARPDSAAPARSTPDAARQ